MFCKLSINKSYSCISEGHPSIWHNLYKVCFFNLIFAIFLVFSVNFKAYSGEAEDFVNSVSNKALGIISTATSHSVINSELGILFENSVNITWIAKFILGKYYQQFSTKEFSEFQGLYKNYLMRKYVPRFKEFSGYESTINYSKSLGKDYYLVQTKILDPSKAKPLTVEYRVKKSSNGRFYIHDITIDGISLILTHRSDFTNFLHTNSISGLLREIESKTL